MGGFKLIKFLFLNGRYVLVVWLDVFLYVVYRIIDWQLIDFGFVCYFVWDICKEWFVLIEFFLVLRLFFFFKGGFLRKVKEVVVVVVQV